MSSSFFLSNASAENKKKSIGKKRKFEGNKNQFGKQKIKKKFLVLGKNQSKNKNSNDASKGHNEEILSDASDVEGREIDDHGSHIHSDRSKSDESDEETIEEKRLRLAKKYLEEIERQEKERIDEVSEQQVENRANIESGLDNAVNLRLRRDDLEESGKLVRAVAHNYEGLEAKQIVDFSGVQLLRDHKVHKLSITCIAISSDGKYILSGSKDGGLVLWRMELQNEDFPKSNSQNDIESNGDVSKKSENESLVSEKWTINKLARVAGGRKGCEDKHVGHCTSVNCVTISSDSKFLASGDDSHLIIIWKISVGDDKPKEDSVSKCQLQSNLNSGLEKIHVFKGHRSPVSGLAFRIGTHTLYSCSHDRSVKVWNLDEMAYVETLFGHQDSITGIDAGIRERVLTSGGRDGTVRIWKIVEESQLVFNAPAVSSDNTKDNSIKGAGAIGSASVDSIKRLDEQHFVTCGEDGHVSLWNVMKKKPVHTIPRAHGSDPVNNDPRWISAIATMQNTDLIASGSSDGVVRLWKCREKFRVLEEIAALQIGQLVIKQNVESICEPSSNGFINGMCFHPSGRALLLGIGQEHR